MKELSGSAMICEALKEENVKIVFGYPEALRLIFMMKFTIKSTLNIF